MRALYLFLKTIHIIGVVLFLGNIIVTAWWKTAADRTRDARVVAFAQRQVARTDFVFTAGGAALLLAGGVGNALAHEMDFLAISWMAWSFYLFLAAAAIWIGVLVPTQIEQGRLAAEFGRSGQIPAEYWRLARRWNLFGALALLLPVIALVLMVYKPA
jgi:uncharacterized membrane protein